MKKLLLSVFMLSTTLAFSQVELFDNAISPTTQGLAAQDFDMANNQYDCMIADDFVVPSGETWWVDSLFVAGQYSGGAQLTSGIIVHIYEDNAGNLGNMVFSDTINENLDFFGDGDLRPHWEEPFMLTAGTYWLAIQARKDFGGGGGQWYWTRDNALNGYLPKWQNPNNGFGTSCTSWITSQNCSPLNFTDSGHVFNIYGCFGPTKPLYPGNFDTLVCAGAVANVTIMADTQGSQSGVTYSWSTGQTGMTITVDSSGVYEVYGENSTTLCGMTQTITVDFVDVQEPEMFDTTICESALPFVYQAPPITCPNCVALWPDSTIGVFYGAEEGGTVTLTIVDTVSGCSKSDDGILTIDPATLTIQPGLLIDVCEGDELTVSTAEIINSYTWQFNDSLNWITISNDDTASVSQTGIIAVSGQTANGCFTTDTAYVTQRALPEPVIDYVSNGSTGNVDLSATGGYASYDWSNGGSGQNISVSSNGVYTVTVTDEYGCMGSEFVGVFTVGAEDVIANQVKVYPNPARDVVTFNWPSTFVGNVDVEIMDLTGRLVSSFSATSMNQQVDLSELTSGQYLIKYTSPEGVGQASLVINK